MAASLPGRVPQDVKFKVRWLTIVPARKVVDPRLHGLLRDGQRLLRILRISTRPKLRSDLEAGNFPNRADSVIVVAAFDHGKRRPTVHSECRSRQPKASKSQYD